ncbi:MAG TPA: YCF48-related protein, partial [Ktedonobacteraceae bacterium]
TFRSYTFTWSGALIQGGAPFGPGGIQVTSPNKPTSSTVVPTGQCMVGAYQPINTLWMSDATTGWARTTTQQILHTTDGGKSWQNVTPPFLAGNMLQTVKLPPVFASLNGTDAWVAVSEKQQLDGSIPSLIFHTSDSGHTWQEAMLPRSGLGVSQVQFVNAQNGWVLADFGGVAAGSQAVNLFRSTDGGMTWRTVASAPGSLPLGGDKSGMGWASATTGWVTGCVCAAENTVLLSRTQDGGVTWQTQSLPLPALQGVFTTEPPVFFSATEGILPVSINYQGRVTLLAVYATHDGGATWSHSTLVFAAGKAWDFLTMQQGWVLGANGSSVNVTSNGGQSWLTNTPSANFQNISQLDFVSAQEGWAISTTTPSAPVLLKTMDGGQTWVQVS